MEVSIPQQASKSDNTQAGVDFATAYTGASFIVVTCSQADAQAVCRHGIAATAVPSAYYADADDISANVTTGPQPITPLDADVVKLAKRLKGAVIICDQRMSSQKTIFERLRAFQEMLSTEASVPVAIAMVPQVEAQPSAEYGPARLLSAWMDTPSTKIGAIINWLEWHMQDERQKFPVNQTGGYIALGRSETGSEIWVWSHRLEAARRLNMRDVMVPTQLTAICVQEWIESHYSRADGRTGKRKVDFAKLGLEIVEKCSAAGIFWLDRLRGAGVWRDPLKTDVLIINSAEGVWRTDGNAQMRVGQHIYQASSSLGFAESTMEATAAEINEFRDALSTWRFTRGETDVKLVLGWVMLAFVCGAIKWRPHISITGALQSGKSTLVGLIGTILGHAALVRDGGSSESGIRQEMGMRSCAVLLDEAESDAERLTGLIAYFRSGSSGAVKALGTAAHSPQLFEMRAMGLVAGIIPPKMFPADESRFIHLQLDGNDPQAVIQPCRLISDTSAAQNLGPKMFARMVRQWPRFCACENVVRQAMQGAGKTPRFIDTFAAPIAASWLGQFDETLTLEEAAAYLAGFDLTEDGSRLDEAADETLIWHHLLYSQIFVEGQWISIATAAQSAHEEELGGANRAALGEKGFKVDEESRGTKQRRLLVDLRNPEIVKLFDGTKWKSANLDVPLRRLEGTVKWKTATRIGSMICKPLSVVLPELS